MKSPRNQIEVQCAPHDSDYLAYVDHVYDCCDAELPSIREHNEKITALLERADTPKDAKAEITGHVQKYVEKIARREGVLVGSPAGNFKAIAERVADDWIAGYEEEQAYIASTSKQRANEGSGLGL